MRGTIELVWADQLPELRMLNRPPSLSWLEATLGGLPDIIQNWDQWIDAYGRLVPAIAVRAADNTLPFNLRASAYWRYVAASKGVNIGHRTITGPVVILSGDDDFMEQALSS